MGRFVLITGRMASGKSKVSELLRKKHYKVIVDDQGQENRVFDFDGKVKLVIEVNK